MFIMNNVLVTPTNISFVFHNYCNYFTAFLIKQQPLIPTLTRGKHYLLEEKLLQLFSKFLLAF